MTITLYQFPYSHYCARVKIILAEKGIPYDAPVISFEWAGSAAGRAINPLGKVPFLVDGEVRLGESDVIAVYLDEAYPAPSMMPAAISQRPSVAQVIDAAKAALAGN